MGFKLVKKATIAGTIECKFDVMGRKFLVKNFTPNNIEVRFSKDDPNPITIPEDTAQLCTYKEDEAWWSSMMTDTVYIASEAASEEGVEVQCLAWSEKTNLKIGEGL